MKIKTKILLGLALAVVFLVFGFGTHKALAQAAKCQYLACSENDISGALGTFKFVNQAEITGIFNRSRL